MSFAVRAWLRARASVGLPAAAVVAALVLVSLAIGPATAAENEAARVLSLRQDRHGVTVEVDGGPFAAYVIDEANKPYLWPVVGPTGKAMTRAYPMRDLPAEPPAQRDHPHHRGITFGHESTAGADTWAEAATFAGTGGDAQAAERRQGRLASLGRIAHRDFSLLALDGRRAIVEETCDHLAPAGKPVLVERRRLTFHADESVRTIDIDQELFALDGPVTLGDRKDAGLYVRVPTTMAVDSGLGGRIVNSEGQADKDAWSKPARWCDYHGPVEGEQLGIAILNHPSSHRHPTRWHVRTYGLFAANPFAQRGYDETASENPTTVRPGEPLHLHHRFVLHAGDEQAAGIEDAWQRYARETPAPLGPAAHLK